MIERFKPNRQFVLYCVIGVSSASLDFLIYVFFLGQVLLHYEAANAIGYASGTIVSFLLNAYLNFKTTDRLAARFLAFCGIAFLGWVASAVILYVAIEEFDLNAYLAKLVAIGFVVFLQYNLNRLISFRGGRA